MKTIIEKTWLPIFPGFYGTIFEPDEESEVYRINIEREEDGLEPLEPDDFNFDYDSYKYDVCLNATEYVEDQLITLGIVKSIKFEELYSPREYNFSNDSINISVELILENLSKYINSNFDNFMAYIEEKYKSYDGFESSYSNNGYDWKEDTENFYKYSDTNQLGSILDFILRNENYETEDDMYEYVSKNVCLTIKN